MIDNAPDDYIQFTLSIEAHMDQPIHAHKHNKQVKHNKQERHDDKCDKHGK